MWSGSEASWFLAIFFLLVAIGYYVERIDRRMRVMKLRQDRLSLTFMKIENDLSSIQDSLIVIGRAQDEATAQTLQAIKSRRTVVLRNVVENGPDLSAILRGIEFPDIDDDPAFWADDRMKKLGLDVTKEGESNS